MVLSEYPAAEKQRLLGYFSYFDSKYIFLHYSDFPLACGIKDYSPKGSEEK